jgi:hypothetical protein
MIVKKRGVHTPINVTDAEAAGGMVDTWTVPLHYIFGKSCKRVVGYSR